jgi:hypothetical protein
VKVLAARDLDIGQSSRSDSSLSGSVRAAENLTQLIGVIGSSTTMTSSALGAILRPYT